MLRFAHFTITYSLNNLHSRVVSQKSSKKLYCLRRVKTHNRITFKLWIKKIIPWQWFFNYFSLMTANYCTQNQIMIIFVRKWERDSFNFFFYGLWLFRFRKSGGAKSFFSVCSWVQKKTLSSDDARKRLRNKF